jgi:hypothetical protein
LEYIAGNFSEDEEIGIWGYAAVYKVITNKQGRS